MAAQREEAQGLLPGKSTGPRPGSARRGCPGPGAQDRGPISSVLMCSPLLLGRPDPAHGPTGTDPVPAAAPESHLKARQLVMMALGSAIGTGLFIGTGAAIRTACPAVLLSFFVACVLLVHGEAERDDMVQYCAEHLDGFATTVHGRVQSYGSRCTRPSVLWGDVSRELGAQDETQIPTHLCHSEFGKVVSAVDGLDAAVTSSRRNRPARRCWSSAGRSLSRPTPADPRKPRGPRAFAVPGASDLTHLPPPMAVVTIRLVFWALPSAAQRSP